MAPCQCIALHLLRVLQYVRGKYAEAAATLESALSLLRNNFEDVEDYLLTVKHR